MTWPNLETRTIHDDLIANRDDDIYDCAREWLEREPDRTHESRQHAADQMADQLQKDYWLMYANDDSFEARLMYAALRRVRWKLLATYFVTCVAIDPAVRIRRRLAWHVAVEADGPPVNVRCKWQGPRVETAG
jgi:hypothetical protein